MYSWSALFGCCCQAAAATASVDVPLGLATPRALLFIHQFIRIRLSLSLVILTGTLWNPYWILLKQQRRWMRGNYEYFWWGFSIWRVDVQWRTVGRMWSSRKSVKLKVGLNMRMESVSVFDGNMLQNGITSITKTFKRESRLQGIIIAVSQWTRTLPRPPAENRRKYKFISITRQIYFLKEMMRNSF